MISAIPRFTDGIRKKPDRSSEIDANERQQQTTTKDVKLSNATTNERIIENRTR